MLPMVKIQLWPQIFYFHQVLKFINLQLKIVVETIITNFLVHGYDN